MAHPVKRPHLLLLHGINGSRDEVQPWGELLSRDFSVHVLNLCGHGGRAVPDELTMARYGGDLIGQMDRLGLHAPIVLGYSFGGLVALHLAIHHPQRVSAVITLATRWLYDARGVGHAIHLLQEARLLRSAQRVEQLRRAHHPNDWKLLAERLRGMYTAFAQQPPVTPDTLSGITCPCLVMTGETDPIAGVEETVALHRCVPGSTVATYSGSAHPPEVVPMAGLQPALVEWIRGGRAGRPG
jgi:pimeloyl-ACP methyl ester carboxylesterase